MDMAFRVKLLGCETTNDINKADSTVPLYSQKRSRKLLGKSDPHRKLGYSSNTIVFVNI
jgi:hypothetical protein